MRKRMESPNLIARTESARGLVHSKTLSRIMGRKQIRQVLECAPDLSGSAFRHAVFSRPQACCQFHGSD